MWCGAPISVGYYIWKSLIPTLLGNIIGGGLFVSSSYYYLYLTGEDGVEINFNIGVVNTAMEAGGPMRNTKEPNQRDESQGTLIGQDPFAQSRTTGHDDIKHLPHPSGQMASALGKELSDHSRYAKTHAERMKTESEEEKV